MKKHIAFLFAALTLAACSDDNDEPQFVPASIRITPGQGAEVDIDTNEQSGTVRFGYQKASVTLQIETNQESWDYSLEQPAERFSVTKDENGLTISVPENKTSLPYQATLTLKAGTESNFARCVLSISQEPTPDPEVSVDPESVQFPYTGGETELTVTTNRNHWTIRKSYDNFVVSKIDDKIIVKARENRTPAALEGTIIVTAGEGEDTIEAEIPVKQQGAPKITVSVDKPSLSFDSEGGSRTVTVTVENADRWDFKCDQTWLEVSQSGNSLTVTAPVNHSANTPSAEITVFAGNMQYNYDQKVVTVSQSPWEHASALVIELTIPEPGEEGVTALLPLSDLTNCTIDWGDGSPTDSPTENLPQHVYTRAGVYQAVISGGVGHIDGRNSKFSWPYRDAPNYITAVINWGNTDIKSMNGAFYKCINLKSIPADTENSFAETTTFEYAFFDCASLEAIPAALFASATKVTEFRNCFDGCTGLKEIPAGMFDNCTAATSFYSTFRECSAVKTIPDRLFAGRSAVIKFNSVFSECSALETIGEGVFAGCTETTSFNQAFSNCGSLKSIPADIFDDCRKATDFRFAFRYGASLTGESPYTVIDGKKVHLYERDDYPDEFAAIAYYANCFKNCPGLSDYDAIVAAGWHQ